MSMNMGGMDMPMEVPPVDMRFDLATTGETTDSDIHYTLNLSNLVLKTEGESQSNPMVATMKKEMEKLVGMSTRAVMKRDGQAISSRTVEGIGQDSQMAEQLTTAVGQSLVVFPMESVGVGARWSVTEQMEERGVKLTRKTVVELKEREGKQVKLGLTITAKPDSLVVLGSDLPPGSTAKIKQFDIKISFRSVLPVLAFKQRYSARSKLSLLSGITG